MTEVFVGIPAQRSMPVATVRSLLNLQGAAYIEFFTDSSLVQARHDIVVAAKRLKCEYVLFLDSDMEVPPDAIYQLLSHEKDIVGINFVTRQGIQSPTSFQSNYNLLDKRSKGLVEVEKCGFGMVLIHLDVFKDVKAPWFNFDFMLEEGYFKSETYYFCDKAREQGYKIFIDCNLSSRVSHVGDKLYTLNDSII